MITHSEEDPGTRLPKPSYWFRIYPDFRSCPPTQGKVQTSTLVTTIQTVNLRLDKGFCWKDPEPKVTVKCLRMNLRFEGVSLKTDTYRLFNNNDTPVYTPPGG